MANFDRKIIESFGDEWSRYDQTGMTEAEAKKAFQEYFSVFPWSDLPPDSEGFDMGCGSGRWAKFVAPRVGKLSCIDPSSAIEIAKKNLSDFDNVYFYKASLDESVLAPSSQDFGYSLGVVHHVPNTAAAIQSCVGLLKQGAPLLLYVYYAFDNRPIWFKFIWRISDFFRHFIARLPNRTKFLLTDLIAILVYWPLSRFSLIAEKLDIDAHNLPLYYYRNRSLYTLRTDSRDRFGTSLESRFTKEQITRMMAEAGLENIIFSESAPFWCVVGRKK
jgi:SAM-dependent methyltransferase